MSVKKSKPNYLTVSDPLVTVKTIQTDEGKTLVLFQNPLDAFSWSRSESVCEECGVPSPKSNTNKTKNVTSKSLSFSTLPTTLSASKLSHTVPKITLYKTAKDESYQVYSAVPEDIIQCFPKIIKLPFPGAKSLNVINAWVVKEFFVDDSKNSEADAYKTIRIQAIAATASSEIPLWENGDSNVDESTVLKKLQSKNQCNNIVPIYFSWRCLLGNNTSRQLFVSPEADGTLASLVDKIITETAFDSANKSASSERKVMVTRLVSLALQGYAAICSTQSLGLVNADSHANNWLFVMAGTDRYFRIAGSHQTYRFRVELADSKTQTVNVRVPVAVDNIPVLQMMDFDQGYAIDNRWDKLPSEPYRRGYPTNRAKWIDLVTFASSFRYNIIGRLYDIGVRKHQMFRELRELDCVLNAISGGWAFCSQTNFRLKRSIIMNGSTVDWTARKTPIPLLPIEEVNVVSSLRNLLSSGSTVTSMLRRSEDIEGSLPVTEIVFEPITLSV